MGFFFLKKISVSETQVPNRPQKCEELFRFDWGIFHKIDKRERKIKSPKGNHQTLKQLPPVHPEQLSQQYSSIVEIYPLQNERETEP